MPGGFYTLKLIEDLKKAIEHEATLKSLQSGRSANNWREFLSPETLRLYNLDPKEALVGSITPLKSDIQLLYDLAKKSKAKVPSEVMERIENYLS
jgi:hypothetical protein